MSSWWKREIISSVTFPAQFTSLIKINVGEMLYISQIFY